MATEDDFQQQVLARLAYLTQRIERADDGIAELGLITRQQRQIIDEMGELRDEVRVMSAMVQRLDGTVVGLVNETPPEHKPFSGP